MNKNGTVNAFYSTPSLYTDRKKAWTATPWEQRYDDYVIYIPLLFALN